MAGEEAALSQSGGGGGSVSFSDLTKGLGDIFGRTDIGGGEERRAGTTKKSERLIVDQAGIAALIDDVLSGTDGLSDIFGAEQQAGIFSGTVAQQATSDLLSNIAGEIAKLTATRETVEEEDITTTAEQKKEEKGLLSEIGRDLKKLF